MINQRQLGTSFMMANKFPTEIFSDYHNGTLGHIITAQFLITQSGKKAYVIAVEVASSLAANEIGLKKKLPSLSASDFSDKSTMPPVKMKVYPYF